MTTTASAESREMFRKLYRNLYEAAQIIHRIDPWEIYTADVPIMVEYDQEKYAAVCFDRLGEFRRIKEIAVYMTGKGLDDYDIVYNHDPCVPREYFMFDRDALVARWGNRSDVPPAQLRLIRELGLRFRGDGRWLYFMDLKGGFLPLLPTPENCIIFTDILIRACQAIEEQLKRNLVVDIARGEVLWNRFDKKTKGRARKVEAARYIAPQEEYQTFAMNDEVNRRRLKNLASNGEDIDVDVFYSGWVPLPADEERPDGRELNLRIMVIYLENDEEILTMAPVVPGVEITEFALMLLHEMMGERGRFRSISVRNRRLYIGLSNICEELGIKLLLNRLPLVDRLLCELRSGV